MADWKDSIVLLTSSDPAIDGFGTGFVFHRDSTGRSFLLTCLHVVDTLAPGGQASSGTEVSILADEKPAEVWSRGDEILDLAVLAVDGLTAQPLPLGRPVDEGARIATAGYTTSEDEHRSVTRRPLLGAVKGNNPVKSRLRPRAVRASYLDLEFETDAFRKLDPGYSGSPVRDEATGLVVGVMNIKRSSTHGHAVCIGSCGLLDPPLAERLPDYRPDAQGARTPAGRPPRAISPGSGAAAAEGALDWLASTIDHGDPIEEVARCLGRAGAIPAPGLWFYAFDACLSDCPRALAEHLAQRFGGLRAVEPWRDALVTDPPAIRFDEHGLWSNLLNQLSGPATSGLTPEAQEELILDWINAEPPAGTGGLRVLYTGLDVERLGGRIPGFIRGAVERFGSLKGIRGGVRLLFLFGCIHREHDWLRVLGLRRGPRIRDIALCEPLGSLSKLSQANIEDWLTWLKSPECGPAAPDRATLQRLRDTLDPLFPNDAARLRYKQVHTRALRVLTQTRLSDPNPGDPG